MWHVIDAQIDYCQVVWRPFFVIAIGSKGYGIRDRLVPTLFWISRTKAPDLFSEKNILETTKKTIDYARVCCKGAFDRCQMYRPENHYSTRRNKKGKEQVSLHHCGQMRFHSKRCERILQNDLPLTKYAQVKNRNAESIRNSHGCIWRSYFKNWDFWISTGHTSEKVGTFNAQ